MKIAYLLDENLSESRGVARKIAAQTRHWHKAGAEVSIYGIRPPSQMPASRPQFGALGLLRNQFASHSRNTRNVIRVLTEWAPDVIYTRYIKYAPGFARALAGIAPYVVEVNTNDVVEFGLKNRWHGAYNRLTRSHFFRHASGMVSVTNELACAKAFTKYALPSIVIGNGIDFADQSIEVAPRFVRPSLLFVGSAKMPWHGVDKVLRLAGALPDYDFHIVGPDPAEFSGSSMGAANVVWHGYCGEEVIADLVARCDAGISSLALHRNGMGEACPLKSRQYLANGLPLIIAYEDPDLSDFGPFVLKIANDENNVDTHLTAIRSFVQLARSCDRKALRDLAQSRVDQAVKEAQRITFLQQFAQKAAN